MDTYGGYARHGGGAFSGKDASKVDRSGAYMARYMAKNVVAAGLAEKCEIQLSYAIGLSEPTSILVDCFGTGRLDDQIIQAILISRVDPRPAAIRQQCGRNALGKNRFSRDADSMIQTFDSDDSTFRTG